MYATNAVELILGITPELLIGKSFYDCIHEDQVPAASDCLESAKSNDSIAYLRFWYRNPRQGFDSDSGSPSVGSDSDEGGVDIENQPCESVELSEAEVNGHLHDEEREVNDSETDLDNVNASGGSLTSTDGQFAHYSLHAQSGPLTNGTQASSMEIEAVVSCTSDGLLVVLRRALTRDSELHSLDPSAQQLYYQGLFSAPWSLSEADYLPYYNNPNNQPRNVDLATGSSSNVPGSNDVMSVIQEVGCFAWPIVGINPTMRHHARGVPRDEAQPREQGSDD